MRSGEPWPGIFRSYWHQWPGRYARDLVAIESGSCPSWGVPVTMTLDEQMAYYFNEALVQERGLLVIHADDDETANALSDACRQIGFTTIRAIGNEQIMVDGAKVILWDRRLSEDNATRDLQRLTEHYGPAPLVALISFPRWHIVDRMKTAGAKGTVSKPFLLDDLYWELNCIIKHHSKTVRSAA